MGVRQVSTTGTRTTGYSTADDWSNASCYGNIQTAINAAGLLDGDQIILDDATHTISFIQSATSSLPTGGRLHIKSRGGVAANCKVVLTLTTNSVIRFNESSLTYTQLVENIEFSHSGTHTTAGESMIAISGTTSTDTEFSGCVFRNFTSVYSGAGANVFINVYSNVARAVAFNNCDFIDLTTTGVGVNWFLAANGFAGQSVAFNGCLFQRITNTITAAASSDGGIYTAPFVSLTMTDCTFDTITSTHSGSTTAAHYPFVRPRGQFNLSGAIAKDCAITGAAAGSAIFRIEGPYTASNLSFDRIVCTPSEGTNAVGGTFLCSGIDAQGTLDNAVFRDCVADFGTAVYFSQGAGGVCTNLHATRCTARVEGIYYFGGDGDMSIDSFSVVGGVTGLELQSGEGYGGAIYAHHNAGANNRDKTTTISNGIIRGVRQYQNGAAGIRLLNYSSTYKHDVAINDVIIDNPGQRYQIEATSSGTQELNVTANGLQMVGGMNAIDLDNAGTGTTNIASISTPVFAARRGVVRGNGVMRRAA